MRLRSVDVFRGLTMTAMVIVNNPGDWATVYWPLLHAEWHGWTPTDLIFPFFLFIVGVSIALAGEDRATPGAVLRRGGAIIGLGVFMAGFPFFNPARWRIPGVLARIGVCYVAAVLVWRMLARDGDVIATARRLAGATALILVGYWAFLTLAPNPAGAAGDLTPAGNVGAWLDRAVFGTHLWKADWDPEGLSSSVPAVATTLLGVIAGLWIRAARPRCGATALLNTGALLAIAGLVWDPVFPINKSLWTSSYVLFTGGLAAIVLAMLHLWLDDGRATPWRARVSEPFVALGRNALLLFVLSGLVAKSMVLTTVGDGTGGETSLQHWIYASVFAPLASPKNASLLHSVTFLLLLYALLALLHRRRWYWSV